VKERTGQEDLIIRYLFGELSEDEERAIEERFLTDNQFFEQMLSVEGALIDAYIQGELSQDERQKVKDSLLTSEGQVGEAIFVKGLVNRLTAMRPADTHAHTDAALSSKVARPDRWRSWLASLSKRNFGKKFSFALLLLISAFSLFLTIWNLNLQYKLSQIEAKQAAMEARNQELLLQLERQGDQNDKLAQNLENERRKLDELAQEMVALQELKSGNDPSQIATLFLTADYFTRSKGELKVFNIRPGVSRLQIIVGNLREDTYESYNAIIQTFEGREILGPKELRPGRGTPDRVSLTLPAALFSDGDYTLTLQGRTESGEIKDIREYYFRIKKRGN
jgi:hypothetical protein